MKDIGMMYVSNEVVKESLECYLNGILLLEGKNYAFRNIREEDDNGIVQWVADLVDIRDED